MPQNFQESAYSGYPGLYWHKEKAVGNFQEANFHVSAIIKTMIIYFSIFILLGILYSYTENVLGTSIINIITHKKLLLQVLESSNKLQICRNLKGSSILSCLKRFEKI